MSFDRLAPFYRTMELLSAGGKLQECRTAFLDEIPVPRNILLAGEGHGRFLPLCAERFPEARITVIDSSSTMLEIASRKVTSEKVSFIHADLLQWDAPAAAFDLVVTHFFLDCFPAEDLASVVSKLGASATPDAGWLIADFQVPGGMAASLRSRIILSLLYTFFRL
ncbi:MAG: class I SAM-dependent methyltransferase, partial [Verrucomicrobiaceae bacterium]